MVTSSGESTNSFLPMHYQEWTTRFGQVRHQLVFVLLMTKQNTGVCNLAEHVNWGL